VLSQEEKIRTQARAQEDNGKITISSTYNKGERAEKKFPAKTLSLHFWKEVKKSVLLLQLFSL
jgi:hypothetical protein